MMRAGCWSAHLYHARLGQLVLLCVMMVLLLLGQQARAEGGLSWEQLSAAEQSVLQPFRSKWGQLKHSTRQTMKRWAGLSSAERARIRHRHQQWQSLSAASQVKIIRKLDRYKRMPLDKRLRLQAWRNWVRRLPAAEQQRLHQRWPNMGSQERKEYIQNLEQKYGKP